MPPLALAYDQHPADPRYYVFDSARGPEPGPGHWRAPQHEPTWRVCHVHAALGRPDPYPRIAGLRAAYRPHFEAWLERREAHGAGMQPSAP